MKKIIFILSLISTSAFAQDIKNDIVTISANYNWSEPAQYGLSFEFTKGFKADDRLTSWILNASYGQLQLDEKNFDITGNGFVVDLGVRT